MDYDKENIDDGDDNLSPISFLKASNVQRHRQASGRLVQEVISVL